jgi:hypothetical protein
VEKNGKDGQVTRWIPKATDTHSECVILNAFPLQQWLHERASMLRYTYIAASLFIASFDILLSAKIPSVLQPHHL